MILMETISFLPCYVAIDQVEAYHAVGRCSMAVRVQHTFYHWHFDIPLPHSKTFSMLVTNTSVVAFALILKIVVSMLIENFSHLLVSLHFSAKRPAQQHSASTAVCNEHHTTYVTA